jgi:hypothetical protein
MNFSNLPMKETILMLPDGVWGGSEAFWKDIKPLVWAASLVWTAETTFNDDSSAAKEEDTGVPVT